MDYIIKEMDENNRYEMYAERNPELKEIAKYSKKELDSMWEEVKRIENPHKYYVDLSKKLWILKNNMLNNIYF